MMSKSRLISVSVLMLVSLFLFYGCGSGQKESSGETATGVSYVGFTVCYNCHSDSKNPSGYQTVFGDSDAAKTSGEGWLSGPHGNNESVDSTSTKTDLSPNNTGFPYYGYSGLGTSSTCTTVCHDKLGDGKLFENFFLKSGVTALGKVNRPIVACESCHGAGGNHYGVGPLPYAKPDPSVCGQCHNSSFPSNHLTYHAEGSSIYEDYSSSPHSRSINSHNYVTGSTTDVRARCSRCHTDEGAKQYIQVVNGTATYDEIVSQMTGKADIANASNVQCRTCHDKHNPHKLLGEKASGLPSTWSTEFKTCTSCHQFLKTDGTLNAEGYHDPNKSAYGALDEIIVDTHYDDPATTDIEGYIIDPSATHSSASGNSNKGICRDCHNPHNADNTINNQWAKSAHGGFILDVKESKGRSGAVGEDEGPAWVHYDFKGSDRQACQRCHTSTGFRNMANAPDSYNPANNVFVATGSQREMLYCWSCHTSNTGNLRNPGKFVSPGTAYVFPSDSGVKRSFPTDSTKENYIAGSTICINCHSGRETGQYIKDYTSSISGKNFGTFNSHYLVAGGVLFKTIGYEYDGMNYANPSHFKHDKIGTNAKDSSGNLIAPNTGSNGPCVGCHMKASGDHLFSPVKKDANGKITEITANEKVCSNCHSGQYALTPDNLEEESEHYNDAVSALQVQLHGKGIYWKGSHPYFYQSDLTTAFTAWPDKNTLGAAFNLNMFKHEPGACAHNRYYTKRLIYDSIDFLDNGTLDNSVKATLNASPHAGASYQAGVTAYILSSTGGRP